MSFLNRSYQLRSHQLPFTPECVVEFLPLHIDLKKVSKMSLYDDEDDPGLGLESSASVADTGWGKSVSWMQSQQSLALKTKAKQTIPIPPPKVTPAFISRPRVTGTFSLSLSCPRFCSFPSCRVHRKSTENVTSSDKLAEESTEI